MQLKEEQLKDVLISNALNNINQNLPLDNGKLRRVQHQLGVEQGILTKSGRPVIPPSLRQIIVSEYHKTAHFGTDKFMLLSKHGTIGQICMLIFDSFVNVVPLVNKQKPTLAHPKPS